MSVSTTIIKCKVVARALPSPLAHHVLLPFKESLILVGGEQYVSSNIAPSCNIHIGREENFKRLVNYPYLRSKHAACIRQDELFCFGEITDFKVGIANNVVQTLPCANVIPRRTLLAAVYSPAADAFFVIGGESGGSRTKDVFKVSPGGQASKVAPLPTFLSGHSAVLWNHAGQEEIVVFGGKTDFASFNSKVFSYNILANTWLEISTVGAPEKISLHGAGIIGDNMIIFGGYNPTQLDLHGLYSLNLLTKEWTKYSTSESTKSSGCACAVVGKKFYVSGGHQGTATLQSMVEYDFSFLSSSTDKEHFAHATFLSSPPDVNITLKHETQTASFKYHSLIASMSKLLAKKISKQKKIQTAESKESPVEIVLEHVQPLEFRMMTEYLYENKDFSGITESENAFCSFMLFMKQMQYDNSFTQAVTQHAFPKVVSHGTVCTIYEFACANSLNKLKESCVVYLANNLEAMVKRQEYAGLSKEQILEVQTYFFSNTRVKAEASSSTRAPNQMMTCTEAIKRHLSTLLSTSQSGKSSSLYDMQVTSGDQGKTYNVHKQVLTGSSAYFKAMLSSEFNESSESHIVMEELNAFQLEIVLEFLYGKDIKLSKFSMENLMALLDAADMLSLEQLKFQVNIEIASKMNTGNVLMILEKGQDIHSEYLIHKCSEFLRGMRLPELVGNILALSKRVSELKHKVETEEEHPTQETDEQVYE